MSNSYPPLSVTADSGQLRQPFRLPPISTQLPEIFAQSGSSSTTPETSSGSSYWTSKRKVSASGDLDGGQDVQMRKRRLTGFSPPPSSGEHSRRPVSWHESLCERLPDREEWQAQSVFRSNQSGVASGIRLPAIKVLEGLPTVQEDRPALRASNASYSRSDPFQNSMRAPAQPMSSLAKQPQILPPERIPRSGSDPIHRALQSPHPLHERTKPIDPWSPHSAPGYATSNAPLQSPHDGGFPRFGSNDYGHDMETRSPGRSWYYVEERTVRPPGYQRTHHREQAASAACQSEPLRNVSPQSAGTTTVHQQNTPSISPMQEAMGTRDFELPRSMDSRNFTLSAHTSPVSQYNWETPDPLADASNRRRRGNLPKESTAVLNTWFCQHVAYPYPKEEEKHRLQTETGLSMSQISNWFINARRRRRPYMMGSIPPDMAADAEAR